MSLLLVAAALLVAACAPVGPASTVPVANTADMDDSVAMTATMPMTEETAGMDHGAMAEEAAPTDLQFIDSMIPHHQSAIEMARQALEEAERPEIRQMAEEIIAAQEAEIARMNEWRAAWYPDAPPTEGMGMEMGAMEIAEDAGKPFNQRFIEAMIPHHQGAIDMAVAMADTADHEELRTLAEEIVAAQKAEIAQMRGWLAEWYGVTE